MSWLSAPDGSRDMLAVLHPPNCFVLWNADTGTKIWRKNYSDTLQGFAFDPFDSAKVACEKLYYIYFKYSSNSEAPLQNLKEEGKNGFRLLKLIQN